MSSVSFTKVHSSAVSKTMVSSMVLSMNCLSLMVCLAIGFMEDGLVLNTSSRLHLAQISLSGMSFRNRGNSGKSCARVMNGIGGLGLFLPGSFSTRIVRSATVAVGDGLG